jgi:hypothetical protein
MEFTTIRQLKKLKSIKPNPQWVALTKKRLLKDEHYYINEPSVFSFWAVMHKGWVTAVAILLVAIGATYSIVNWQNRELINTLLSKLDANSTPENQKLISSLDTMKGSLAGIKDSLDSLKLTGDKKQALAVASVAKTTAQNGRAAVQELKSGSQLTSQVKASLDATEKGFQEVEQLSADVQKDTVETLIKDLKERTLNSRDKALLEKAEQDYQQGRVEDAVTKLLMIGSR